MYKIIDDLPIDYDFKSKSKSDLNLYGRWFNDHKNERLNYLKEAVSSSPDFSNWKADFSPESLKPLGDWLYMNVETEKLSDEDYEAKRRSVPDYIKINDWDLTVKTRSLIVDVGIYFGEVFIHKYPNLSWEQHFSKIKNDGSHGHMVIKGFGKMFLNPILVMLGVGQSFADNSRKGDRLYELFQTWEKYLKK